MVESVEMVSDRPPRGSSSRFSRCSRVHRFAQFLICVSVCVCVCVCVSGVRARKHTHTDTHKRTSRLDATAVHVKV